MQSQNDIACSENHLMKQKRIIQFAPLIVLLITFNTFSQTPEKGPWWPHPIWGVGDQAGGSNWITPEKILSAMQLVKHGKVYELGHTYEPEMPFFGKRSYTLKTNPDGPSGGPVGDNKLVFNEELLTTEIGQVGTQFDGPGHVGTQVTFDDGSVKDVYYNGYRGDQMYSPNGLRKLGVENVKPIITRGILIDIAGYKNVDVLPNSYEVTLADVKGAMKQQDLEQSDIKKGDAIFFRFGWSKYWNDPKKYNHHPPGIGLEVAKWVVEMNASMVGSDQYGTEVEPYPNPKLAGPVHQFLITQNGIFNLENLNFDGLIKDQVYQFMFFFTPIRFKGATGSPGRPLVIK